MRIGIDARFFGGATGIGRYISELFKAMLGQSEDKFVLFLRKDNWDDVPQSPRVEKRLADVRWYTLAEQLKLPKIFDGAGCDLLHFPHWNVPLLVRTPYVLTIHDLLLLEHPSRRASFLGPIKYAIKYAGYRLVLKNAISRARRIIAPSKFTARQIKLFFRAENKTQVIYEGLSHLPRPQDSSTILARGVVKQKLYYPPGRAEKPYALYVGNAYPHKNLDFLIMTVKKMREKGEKIKLLLVGEDDFYKKLRKKYSGNDSIIFFGKASDEELSALYVNAHVYVFPSLHEGFGLTGLEAMSYGLPVVAARNGALPEIYGEAAEYFDPTDEKSLEDALIKINNETRRNELKFKGSALVEGFKWDNAARETLKIYREAIK